MDLAAAVRTSDRHNAKIIAQRASITSRAEEWRRNGEISEAEANEILEIIQAGDLRIWRPQLYIIPKAGIDAARVELVPFKERAGLGEEFRIKDLRGSEFDRVTFDGF